LIREIEELTLRAWPAFESQPVDGWLARFADGCSKRSNSVQVLAAGESSVEEKIRRCELLYRERGLPPIFKLTQAARPVELDRRLALLGYRLVDPTSVCLLALARHPAREVGGAAEAKLRIEPRLARAWFEAPFQATRGRSGGEAALRRLLGRIEAPCAFASVAIDGRIAARALGVVRADLLVISDVGTDPARRGQGLATRLTSALLEWATDRGARRAVLQRVVENRGAIPLYAQFGFREVYRYWYRVAPRC